MDTDTFNIDVTDSSSSVRGGPMRKAPVINPEDHCQSLRNATILMVDDEPTTLEIIQSFLEAAGYSQVVTMSESTLALERIATEIPDVVLLDLNMPDVTGIEILTAMRADQKLKHIPVIILTASTDVDTKLDVLRLGATDFLAKPVDPSELVLRLQNTLAAKAYQDHIVNYDALTGLPNRRMFMRLLERALWRAKHDGTVGAALHLDLDRFQQINETLGNTVGDELLKRVSHRLERYVRAGDAVAKPTNNQTDLSRVGAK